MKRLPYPGKPLGQPKKKFEDTFRLSQAMLGKQVRDYEDTQSVWDVLIEKFNLGR